MSRIQAIHPDEAQGSARSMLTAVQASLGIVPNMFLVAANSPAALEALTVASGALAKGFVGAGVREAIALTVAEANGCDYCLSAHTALGNGAGLSEADIENARHGRATEAKVDTILTFSRSLVLNRGRVGNAEIEDLRRAGVTNGEIVEIVAVVALNIFTNYLNQTADTDIDFPVVRAGLPLAA